MTQLPTTKQLILSTTRKLFAHYGYGGFSMRTLAKASGLSLSSIYHHFNDKDELLKICFDSVNKNLGEARKNLPVCDTATEELRQRIEFQFVHAEKILFVLRYYLHFRKQFPRQANGYLGEKAYRHVKEVLERGVESGEFERVQDIDAEAKIITHSINGFVLEYFPESPTTDEFNKLVDEIHEFMVRRLSIKAGQPA